MIAIPAEMLSVSAAFVWQAGLVFLRVAALVSVLPAFGEQTVPMRVKLGIAIAFAAIVLPAAPALPVPPDLLQMARLVVVETIVGLAMGIAIRLFALALQVTGAIAAHATSLSQIMGGAVPDPSPAMGHVLVVAGLALAVMLDLHVHAAALIILSYDVFPFGFFPSGQALSAWGVHRIASTFGLAFALAAPFVIASTIYNLALGAINRAMPQLMVAFVGAPVITFGGLLLLCLSAPILMEVWGDTLFSFLSDPWSVP